MEKNFYTDDNFEDFLKQKSDQYKMYPSDKVWKNIHGSLHTRRKWFIMGMFTLISGILFFAGKELLAPSPASHLTAKKMADSNKNPVSIPQKAQETILPPAFTEYKIPSKNSRSYDRNILVAPVVDSTTGQINISVDGALLTNQVSSPILIATESDDQLVQPAHQITAQLATNNTEHTVSFETPSKLDEEENKGKQSPVKSALHFNQEDVQQSTTLQSIAPYQLNANKKLNRKYWQIYASPTVNYRKLSSGNLYVSPKASNVQSVPIASPSMSSNPNQYINNKPALGLELGSSFIYRYTRNLSFKAGLQFNYSMYTIDAYASNISQPATIQLNTFNGAQANTLTSYTNIGNIGGKANLNLQNQYYQLSVPLGFELRIMGNEKLQLHIGATIQPTYLLNRNAYLLANDYTSYTQEPSLFRRWNFNGAVEAFLSYKVGRVRLQFGPQFRYQLLSTYTEQYPITENLKEFGFKLGLTKSIW